MSDALGIASILIATGRTVRPKDWVAELIEQEREATMEALF